MPTKGSVSVVRGVTTIPVHVMMLQFVHIAFVILVYAIPTDVNIVATDIVPDPAREAEAARTRIPTLTLTRKNVSINNVPYVTK